VESPHQLTPATEPRPSTSRQDVLSTPTNNDGVKSIGIDFANTSSPSVVLRSSSSPSSLEVILEKERLAQPISSSRRMCDLSHFVEEIRKIESHTLECLWGGRLVHEKTECQGMVSVLHFVCSKELCPFTGTVQTAEPGSIHLEAAIGGLAVGIGYAQIEEYLGIMGSPFLGRTVYRKYKKRAGDVLNLTKQQDFISAIQAEKEMAVASGDVDEDNNPCITVVVDGGWSKRSYGHGYNANSGTAAIIGERTKKILFSGVRNKYCHICRLAEIREEDVPEHVCNANWTGPSTAMEADIIVEGLKFLQEQHGLLCTRIIGDGDSSTMSKIRQSVSYGMQVQKIECANHAVRNFRKKLEAAAINSKAFPGGDGLRARRILKSSAARMAALARGTIASHAIGTAGRVTSDSVSGLRKDLQNVPYHVLGMHANCPASLQCSSRKDRNLIPELKRAPGLLEAIGEATARLAALSNSLIFNATNNLVEQAMSHVAKTTGGKRVNFSSGRGYADRVSAAALSFNKPAQAWHLSYRKTGVPSPLAKLVGKRKKLLLLQRTKASRSRDTEPNCDNADEATNDQTTGRKRKFPSQPADLDYGAPDVDPDVLTQLCDDFFEAQVQVTPEQRRQIEEETRTQAKGSKLQVAKWMSERQKRISASNAKKVFQRRPTTLCASLVKDLLRPKTISSAAIDHGIVHEAKAKERYSEEFGVVVEDCGIYIDLENPFLCASPDGLVRPEGEDPYLLEIKCPFNARYCSSIKTACEIIEKFPLHVDENGQFYLPEDHPYFFQIQVQLQCSNLERCDYVVFLLGDRVGGPGIINVVRILRDRGFMLKVLSKLKEFYFECALPELADSRIDRGGKIREPSRILDARATAADKKAKKDQKRDKTNP
jgi:hypothetical protein